MRLLLAQAGPSLFISRYWCSGSRAVALWMWCRWSIPLSIYIQVFRGGYWRCGFAGSEQIGEGEDTKLIKMAEETKKGGWTAGISWGSHMMFFSSIQDPLVSQAVLEQYRSRSAYKLIELDDKYHFLKKGSIVVSVISCYSYAYLMMYTFTMVCAWSVYRLTVEQDLVRELIVCKFEMIHSLNFLSNV